MYLVFIEYFFYKVGVSQCFMHEYDEYICMIVVKDKKAETLG